MRKWGETGGGEGGVGVGTEGKGGVKMAERRRAGRGENINAKGVGLVYLILFIIFPVGRTIQVMSRYR